MREILENETKRAALKKRLFEYPGATGENVELLLSDYEERVDLKKHLMSEGFSNARAESYLDRKGYPWPPGWHSVFFYPGSNRVRNGYIILIIIIIGMMLITL